MTKEQLSKLELHNTYTYRQLCALFEERVYKTPELRQSQEEEWGRFVLLDRPKGSMHYEVLEIYKTQKPEIVKEKVEEKPKEKKEKKEKTIPLTAEEKKELDDLYNYIRSKVLGYDETIALPSSFVRRLIGIRYGQAIANNHQERKALYSFTDILLTFKFCKVKIDRAISTKKFKTEYSKFLYISKIVESDLPTVVMRRKKAEHSQKVMEETEVVACGEYDATLYKRQTKENKSSLLEGLW